MAKATKQTKSKGKAGKSSGKRSSGASSKRGTARKPVGEINRLKGAVTKKNELLSSVRAEKAAIKTNLRTAEAEKRRAEAKADSLAKKFDDALSTKKEVTRELRSELSEQKRKLKEIAKEKARMEKQLEKLQRRGRRRNDGKRKLLTAFMRFSGEVRPQVVAENPELKFGEIGKRIGQHWQTEKAANSEMYQRITADYAREKAELDAASASA